MPLDHIGFGHITDLQASRKFYEQALSPIGYKVQIEVPGRALGFGSSPYSPDFWIATACGDYIPSASSGSAAHVAFKGTRAQVDAFHKAAIQAGGKCNGPPGLRPQYHPFYYGAFIIDPNGNNIEVVNHGSAWKWLWFCIGTKFGFITANCPGTAGDKKD